MVALAKRTPLSRQRLQLQLGMVEQLEDRRLMAADTFEAQQQVGQEITLVVQSLAEMVSAEASAELLQRVQQQLPEADVFQFSEEMHQANPSLWGEIIDQSSIPELGQLLGQQPEAHMAVTDLVLLNFVELANEEAVSSHLTNQLEAELLPLLRDCEDSPEDVDDQVTEELPSQYESLRQQLGDEQFSDWLESNSQQTGRLSGVSDSEAAQLPPEALEQLDSVEQALDRWQRAFRREAVEALEPLYLVGDLDENGTIGFEDFLIVGQNFGQEVALGTDGDINLDGVVSFPDFLVIAEGFGNSNEFDVSPQAMIAGNVAYHSSLFTNLFFDVVVDIHKNDPLTKKAAELVVAQEWEPIQDGIREKEAAVQADTAAKAKHAPGSPNAAFYQGRIDQLKAELKTLKRKAVGTQEKIKQVCIDKNEAKKVVKARVDTLGVEKAQISQLPTTTDAEREQKEKSLQENIRETDELEALLR